LVSLVAIILGFLIGIALARIMGPSFRWYYLIGGTLAIAFGVMSAKSHLASVVVVCVAMAAVFGSLVITWLVNVGLHGM
jgi:hypothetical protein